MTTTPTTCTTTAVPSAADVARPCAADRIANWWPKGMTPTSPEPADVAFTRAVVGAVPSFRHAKDAGHLLGTCGTFARWLIATNLPLDPRTAFTPEHLDAYLAGPLAGRPQGSRDATMSHLRRIAITAATVPADVSVEAPVDEVPVDAEALSLVDPVEHVLGSFVPSMVNPARFAIIEGLVRKSVRACHPSTTSQARTLLRNAAYLAAWVDQCGRPARLDVVFHPDTVEEFAGVLATTMPTASAATIASSLRKMSRTLLPKLSPTARTRHGRSAWSNPPYRADEAAALFANARRAFTAKRRRHLSLVLCMGLGTGANGGEMGMARPGDVGSDAKGRTTLTLRSAADVNRTRTVVVLDAYAELFATLVAEVVADDDIWLLGGGGGKRTNRVSNIVEDTTGKWVPELDIFRLRNTYLVTLVGMRHTAVELLDAAGVSTLGSLDEVVRRTRAVSGDQSP